jgi:elongation factor P
VTTYKTSEFRKGLKVQIDGEPYLMIEMNFVKPGKGNALYKCKLRNLVRGTVIDRTYKGGDSLEGADVEEIEVQYLYRHADTFVFMRDALLEEGAISQASVLVSEFVGTIELELLELSGGLAEGLDALTSQEEADVLDSFEQVDDAWKYLKEGMVCSMVLYNGNPITMTPPNHVELKVEYCEPGVKGDTATNVTKPVKVETGAEFLAPAFINMGNVIKIDTRTGEYVERVST